MTPRPGTNPVRARAPACQESAQDQVTQLACHTLPMLVLIRLGALLGFRTSLAAGLCYMLFVFVFTGAQIVITTGAGPPSWIGLFWGIILVGFVIGVTPAVGLGAALGALVAAFAWYWPPSNVRVAALRGMLISSVAAVPILLTVGPPGPGFAVGGTAYWFASPVLIGCGAWGAARGHVIQAALSRSRHLAL